MSSPYRAWAEISLSALRENAAAIRRRLASRTRLMAVVKADAYGMGAVPFSRELAALGVDAFGVGDSSEALQLRQAGLDGCILILGAIVPGEVKSVVAGDLSVCIHAEDRLAVLVNEARRQGKRCRVHLKVDTGMGRLGVLPSRALDLARRIARERDLVFEGVATHLADVSPADSADNLRQLEIFAAVQQAIRREGLGEPIFHAAASSSVFAALPATFDLVRVGLALHGLLPGLSGSEFDLRPVLSLRSQVIFLKDVQAGTSLGYGRTYRTPRAIRVATIPMGYNDGLPLGLSNQGRVLVGGRFAPVIGAVSMDYTTLDVGAISGVQVGDAVTIVGRDGEQSIGLPDLARWAETIPHEILCSIGKRVTRIYHSAVPRVQAAAH